MREKPTGQEAVTDLQLKEFTKSIQLIEPFYSEIYPDAQGVDHLLEDGRLATVMVFSYLGDRELEIEPFTSYSIGINEISKHGDVAVRIARDYAVMVLGDDEDNKYQQTYSEHHYRRDEQGNWTQMRDPVLELSRLSVALMQQGDMEGSREAAEKARRLDQEATAIKDQLGGDHEVSRHIEYMSILRLIYEELSSDTGS